MKKKFDYSMLIGKIINIFGSKTKFAKAMEMSKPTLLKKLKCEVEFKQSEIIKAAELLDIPIEKIREYFFCYYN